MNARRDSPEGQPAGGYQRLRPASSRPLGVLALAAASRVGGWTPPLPPRPRRQDGTGSPASATARHAWQPTQEA